MSDRPSIRAFVVATGIAAIALTAATASAARGQERPAAQTGDSTSLQEQVAPSKTVLDLIPGDAALAIGIPNLVRLKERGDHLLNAVNAQSMRFSKVFEFGYDWLGIQGIVDETRPAVAMLVNVHDVGLADAGTFEHMFETFVVYVPVKDRHEAAKRVGLPQEALADGAIAPTRDTPARFVTIREDYLLLAWNKRAIESVLEGESLTAAISQKRRAAAADADFLLLIGTKSLGKSWEDYVADVATGDIHLPDVPRQDEIRDLLQKTVPDAEFALVTGQIDDGVQLRIFFRFREGGTAQAALADLGSGAEPATPAGLPQGNVLAAVAANGDGLAPINAARLLLPVVLNNFSRPNWLVENDPGRLVGTFDAIGPHLDGCRIALYATGATTPTELSNRGSMAAVFVLQTADPESLLDAIAREGISLGGSGGDEEDGEAAPPLRVRRRPDPLTAAGHSVERLEIDTEGIAPELGDAFREAFGPAWMYLRAAQQEGRLVVLLGSQLSLLEETLANLDAHENGLLATGPLQLVQSRLDTAHQAALYVSLRRTLPALAGEVDDWVDAMNQDIERLTAFGLVIEKHTVQIEAWIPLAELQALPEKWRLVW